MLKSSSSGDSDCDSAAEEANSLLVNTGKAPTKRSNTKSQPKSKKSLTDEQKLERFNFFLDYVLREYYVGSEGSAPRFDVAWWSIH